MFPCLFHASFVYQVGFRFSLRIHISLVLKIFSQSTLAGGEGEFFFFFFTGARTRSQQPCIAQFISVSFIFLSHVQTVLKYVILPCLLFNIVLGQRQEFLLFWFLGPPSNSVGTPS